MRSFLTISTYQCTVVAVSRKGKGHWERQCTPMANVEAPEGYEFSGGETVLCAHTAADLDTIERTETLTLIQE